jgi:hypothetical protein
MDKPYDSGVSKENTWVPCTATLVWMILWNSRLTLQAYMEGVKRLLVAASFARAIIYLKL